MASLHVVLHPPGVPMQAERVHQMHPGALRLKQIGRPVPAVASPPGPPPGPGRPRRSPSPRPADRCRSAPSRAPRRPRSSARSPTGGDADQCRHTVAACSTRVSFRRLRVGWETPSVPRTFGSRRREELWRITTDLATKDPLHTARRPSPHHRARSRKSGAALLHDINSGRAANPDLYACVGDADRLIHG